MLCRRVTSPDLLLVVDVPHHPVVVAADLALLVVAAVAVARGLLPAAVLLPLGVLDI